MKFTTQKLKMAAKPQQTKLSALLFSVQTDEVLIPLLKSFLMKEFRDIESGKISAQAGTILDAKLSAKTFATRAVEYNHDSDDEKTKDYFHPSSIGNCQRKLAFQRLDAPTNGEPSGAELLRQALIFEIGTYVHVLFQNLCERAGILEAREVSVIDHKRCIIGHADGILKIKGHRHLLEIKSCNLNTYSKLRQPKPEHEEQAMIYMKLLNLDSAFIVYFHKDTSQIKEFRIKLNESLWKNRVEPRILNFQENMRKHKLPKREGELPSKFPCTYCEFSRICYDSFQLDKFIKAKKFTKL